MLSENTIGEVEDEVLKYIQSYCPEGEAYLAGNSVHFDKEFMRIEFPRVLDYLCHRIVGMSVFS